MREPIADGQARQVEFGRASLEGLWWDGPGLLQLAYFSLRTPQEVADLQNEMTCPIAQSGLSSGPQILFQMWHCEVRA